MYRPTRIEVRRCAYTWNAYIIERDDGINDNGLSSPYSGLDVEQGPYTGLTHRRTWHKAYRAAGNRLWDLPKEGGT